MRHYTLAIALFSTLAVASSAQAVVVDWVGAPGTWNVDAQWNDGGVDSDALTIFNTIQGWNGGGAAIADADIVIGAGDDVFYDGGSIDPVSLNQLGDWRMDANGAANGGSLTVSGGGKFTINSSEEVDGEWSQFDADSFTVTGAGSVFSKTFSSADPRAKTPSFSSSGGAFIIGSFRGDGPQSIAINVADGGRFEVDGQLQFGYWDRITAGDPQGDLSVTMTISGESQVALTGGDNVDLLGGAAGGFGNSDLILHRSWNDVTAAPMDETYRINFVGHGGSLSVDQAGILMPVQIGNGFSLGEFAFDETIGSFGTGNPALVTYQDLWSGKDRGVAGASIDDVPAGILQANGSSAGAMGDYFAVVGSSGSNGYKLTSIQGAAAGGSNEGDINGDLVVDSADSTILFANWGTGTTVSEGDISSISGPDPTSDDIIDGRDAGVMFANFSNAAGPAGTASAIYDPVTGNITVSVADVNNWFIESTSSALTGAADGSDTLPSANPGNLISDSDIRVGETSLSTFTYAGLDMGLVATTGLTLGELNIFWNAGLGQPLQSAAVTFLGAGQVGDFDGDLDVDGFDFLVWQQGGSPNPLSASDLADWEANFGTPSPGVGAGVGAVPEPTSLLLLLTGGLACVATRRRRR